jgi:hypothetical protein
MATIIQRCLTTTNSGGAGGDGFNISDAEKEQLLNDINKLNETK